MERTCVILKPDAVNRGLMGEILKRFENKGFRVIGLKMERLAPTKLEEHYAHHKDKPFFQGLVKYMASIPCVVIALEGVEAVEVVRKMVGSTHPHQAVPGTIRADFSMTAPSNLIHASDSQETAEKEIKRFFKESELHAYPLMSLDWLYSEEEKKA